MRQQARARARRCAPGPSASGRSTSPRRTALVPGAVVQTPLQLGVSDGRRDRVEVGVAVPRDVDGSHDRELRTWRPRAAPSLPDHVFLTTGPSARGRIVVDIGGLARAVCRSRSLVPPGARPQPDGDRRRRAQRPTDSRRATIPPLKTTVRGPRADRRRARRRLRPRHGPPGERRPALRRAEVAWWPPTASTTRPPPACGSPTAPGHRGMAVGRNVRRAEGRFGRGLAFNGTSSSLTVAGRPVLDLRRGMTLSAWVKPQAANGKRTILARLGRGGTAYAVHAATARGGPGGEARVARGTKRVGRARGPAARQVDARRPHLRRLARCASTENAERGRLGRRSPAAIRDANGPLRIGGRVPGGGWFKGVLDEVRVYNRALSAAEIRQGMRPDARPSPAPAAAPPPAPAAAGPSASGVPAPRGDLPGWRQIFLDDFTQNVASWGNCSTYDQGRNCPACPSPTARSGGPTPPATRTPARRTTATAASTSRATCRWRTGMLRCSCAARTARRRPRRPRRRSARATYGRFAVRLQDGLGARLQGRLDVLARLRVWGEIDFPEGELDGDASAPSSTSRRGRTPSRRSQYAQGGAPGTPRSCEWTPGQDARSSSTTSVSAPPPAGPGHPDELAAPVGDVARRPARRTASVANIYVDWVAAWAPA